MDRAKTGAAILLWTFLAFSIIAAILCVIQNHQERDKELCNARYCHVDLSDPSLGLQRELDRMMEEQRREQIDQDWWSDDQMKAEFEYQPTC